MAGRFAFIFDFAYLCKKDLNKQHHDLRLPKRITMVKVGYARVSSREQHLDLQLTALKKEGCDKIFQEKVSGIIRKRPALEECLRYLREGDILVVYKFDRLGRSLKNLMEIFEELDQRHIALVSIKDGIDGSSTTGKLMMTIIAAIAEFERSVIRERSAAGLREAKLKGKKLGRPKGAITAKVDACVALYQSGQSVESIMQNLGVKSRSTIYRWLKLKGVKVNRRN